MSLDGDQLSVELLGEFRRVGVTDDELHGILHGPFESTAGEMQAVGYDGAKALEVLRTLPDRAGTASFVAAMGRDHFERFSARARRAGAAGPDESGG